MAATANALKQVVHFWAVESSCLDKSLGLGLTSVLRDLQQCPVFHLCIG